MNRIATCFAQLRTEGRKAFIPYLMGGDPDLETTARCIERLVDSGADLIEVGVPFSDPLADGPTIQAAAVRSLANGCTINKLFDTLTKVNAKIQTPVLLMIYYNMIFQRGVRRFLSEAAAAGCAGLIIPDLPPDEAAEMIQLAGEERIGLNFLVAPTSNKERIIQAAGASSGFIYAVSLKGVTGVRTELPKELPEFVARIKAETTKPVAVGFGIATPEQAKQVAQISDGVIVGSALVKAAADDPSLAKVTKLAQDLRKAIG